MGHYQFLRETAKGPFGPLFELRSVADAAGLNGLGRLITFPTQLASDAEQAIAEAAWESLELRHELVLCVADVVFGKGWVTLVHDYLDGSMLRALQRRAHERQSAFPLAVALRVALDMLDGLELSRGCCEAAGIDWRPGGVSASSLYLCGDGRTRALDGQMVATLLQLSPMRSRAGQVGYPAPELLDSEPSADERTDVFSIGAVLWELLTGRELTLSSAVVQGQRPRSKAPNLSISLPKGTRLPSQLVQTVQSALDLDREKRPATLAELRRTLESAGEVATYEKVIDFTDALLSRESTLFRLTLDREPRLSDERPGERPSPPHLEWVLDLAKHARSVEEQRTTQSPRSVRPRPAKPTPSLPHEILTKPNMPAPDAVTAVGTKKLLPSRTLIGIAGPPVALEATEATPYDEDATVELQLSRPTSELNDVVPLPVPGTGAAALLDASLEQLAPVKPGSLASDVISEGAVVVPISEPLSSSQASYPGIDDLLSAAPEPSLVSSPASRPRGRLVQLSLPLLLVGILGTVGASVLCTVAILHIRRGSASPVAAASKPAPLEGGETSRPVAESAPDESPASSAPSTSVDSNPGEPAQLPPNSSALSAASSEAAVAVPAAVTVPPPALAPAKTTIKKRRKQYVPRGL